MSAEKIVTVFGSSRPKAGDAEYEEARELGKLLAKRGFAVCRQVWASATTFCASARLANASAS